MEDVATLAREFVAGRFGCGVAAAFLGGSAATGTATAGSDLDIVVILDERWAEVAFVETSRFRGKLVEAFVYGPRELDQWLARTRQNGRPTVDRLIAESIMLVDTDLARGLRRGCRQALDVGPAPLVGRELDEAQYTVSTLLDDLAGARDPATEFAVAAALWRAAAELSLRSRGRWVGSGKWLVRELRRDGDPHGLAAWASDPSRSCPGLSAIVHQVLADCGGYLQEGMLRGKCPPEFRPLSVSGGRRPHSQGRSSQATAVEVPVSKSSRRMA